MSKRPRLCKVIRYLTVLFGFVFVAGNNGGAWAQTDTTSRTPAQLEQLVAPIALYPDALLSQILMASTYPLEVVAASRWVQANPGVSGKAPSCLLSLVGDLPVSRTLTRARSLLGPGDLPMLRRRR
jgi:hypothetical protein